MQSGYELDIVLTILQKYSRIFMEVIDEYFIDLF